MTIKYRALYRTNHEIRLLEVLGQGQDARYRQLPACRVFHTTLSEKPRFVALSYTWGDAVGKRLVLVDGSPIRVTTNLYDAIMALRHPDQSRIIWVDALCINQKDDAEKSWQVGLMRDIYQQSSQVLAWLGPAQHDSDAVMTFLKNFGRKAEACGIESVEGHHLDVWSELADKEPTIKQESPQFCVGTVDGSVKLIPRQALIDLFCSISGWHCKDDLFPVAGMQRLFTRPWWGRVWVLQEIALPGNALFVCGTQSVSRRRCRAALSAYIGLWTILMRNTLSRAWSPSPYHTAITTTMFHHQPNIMLCGRDLYQRDHFPLAALLRATCVGSINLHRHGPHHLESTDPRDKVFALLGLASDRADLEQRGIIPDYTRNCVDVYTATMAAMLEQGHMSLLSLCQSPKIQQNLPSWVVDWSRSATDMLQDVRNDHVTVYPTFNASLMTAAGPNVVVEKKDGLVDGISLFCHLYDEVEAAASFPSRRSTNEVPFEETYSWPRRWLIGILCLTYHHKTNVSFRQRLTATARTSIGDVGYDQDGMLSRVGDGRFSDAVTLLRCALPLIKQRQIRLDADKFLASLTTEEDTACRALLNVKLSSEIIGKSLGRLPFITSKGHFMLSSEHVRGGDIVALVKGCQVPFVFRRQEGDRYTLISEAYVDGIMDGEAAMSANFNLVRLS